MRKALSLNIKKLLLVNAKKAKVISRKHCNVSYHLLNAPTPEPLIVREAIISRKYPWSEWIIESGDISIYDNVGDEVDFARLFPNNYWDRELIIIENFFE